MGISRLQFGLFLIRATVTAMFLVWAVRKVTNPEAALGVFQTFYLLDITPEIVLGLGILQCAFILAFFLGNAPNMLC